MPTHLPGHLPAESFTRPLLAMLDDDPDATATVRQLSGRVVLVVDGLPVRQQVAAAVLQRLGLTVVAALDPHEAVRMVAEGYEEGGGEREGDSGREDEGRNPREREGDGAGSDLHGAEAGEKSGGGDGLGDREDEGWRGGRVESVPAGKRCNRPWDAIFVDKDAFGPGSGFAISEAINAVQGKRGQGAGPGERRARTCPNSSSRGSRAGALQWYTPEPMSEDAGGEVGGKARRIAGMNHSANRRDVDDTNKKGRRGATAPLPPPSAPLPPACVHVADPAPIILLACQLDGEEKAVAEGLGIKEKLLKPLRRSMVAACLAQVRERGGGMGGRESRPWRGSPRGSGRFGGSRPCYVLPTTRTWGVKHQSP